MKRYNLKSEVEKAVLRNDDPSALVTPAGFQLVTDPNDFEIKILITPDEEEIAFDAPMAFSNDDDDHDLGDVDDVDCEWHIYLPESLGDLSLSSDSKSYAVEDFVQDIFRKHAALTDVRHPEATPIVVVFHRENEELEEE